MLFTERAQDCNDFSRVGLYLKVFHSKAISRDKARWFTLSNSGINTHITSGYQRVRCVVWRVARTLHKENASVMHREMALSIRTSYCLATYFSK